MPLAEADGLPDERVPEFARVLADILGRAAADYADRLRRSPHAGRGKARGRATELSVLNELEDSVIRALGGYRPIQPRSRGVGKLVFQPLYDRVGSPGALGTPAEQRLPTLITALLAAQVEARGPLRQSTSQSERLAEIAMRIGAGLDDMSLPLLAKVAYDRAARLYFQIEDFSAQDDARFRSASARRRATPWGPRRLVQSLSAALFGYGLRPARFLGWMGVQTVAACSALLLVPKHRDQGGTQDRWQTVYIALQDYINPMGVGDTSRMSHWSWLVLTLDSYLGWFSTSVFFALLLRKWFRA